MENVSKVSDLLSNAEAQNLCGFHLGKVGGRTDVEKLGPYNGGSKSVAADRTMQIIVSSNGNLGGVAGYNAPTGELNRCVSGSWLLVNKSDGIGVGTGGIVGMNERKGPVLSAQSGVCRPPAGKRRDQPDLQAALSAHSRIRPTPTGRSKIVSIMVLFYGYQSHYSGGIVGQWTNNGGRLRTATTTAICRRRMKPAGSVHPAVSWHSCIMRPPVRFQYHQP